MSDSTIGTFVGLLVSLALVVAASACGGGTTNTSSQSYDCCLNGEYYQCDDQEEFETCNLSEETTCDRDPTQDDKCDD